MPKASDNTMRELEDILNESETYADRLTAFLKLKTAPKPQASNSFVMGDVDISFDFDVDLVKLPPKPQPAAAAKEQPLREITNTSNPSAATDHKAQTAATVPSSTQENSGPSLPPTSINSPRRSSSRRSGIHVPGSDRLRRVAIQRLSRSCGRRDLLKEFDDVTSSSSDFLPPTSSTPASEKKATAEPSSTVTAVPLLTQSVPPSDLLASVSEHSNLQRSTTTDSGDKRRTYTIEMGPEPGQLVLSPSRNDGLQNLRQRLSQLSPSNSTYNVSLRQSRLRLAQAKEQAELSAARLEMLARNTPVRTRSQSQSEPEYIVPETQSQQLPQMLQNLSSNGTISPFMVVPMVCVSPQVAPAQAQTQMKAAAQVVASAPVVATAPVVAPAPVVTVASRSVQTLSLSPPATVQNLSEIMTEDESPDELQASGVALNLAHAGGHTNRLRQTRQRAQRVDKSMQLLDLHRSRSANARSRGKCKPRQTVLNKPSRAPINGEQFARELARMSNYEIIDLRKRNSIGKLHPLNGHRQQAMEQQLAVEQHIEWEILRRNLEDPVEQVLAPTTPVPRKSNRASFSAASPAIPPMDFRDRSMLERHLDSSKQHQRRSRFRRHETLMQTTATEPMSPTAPPSGFRDNLMQSLRQQQPQRRLRSRHRELSTSEETVCTPPEQFRRSRSRSRRRTQQEQQQQQLPEPTLPAPPLEFIDVSESNAEDLQQQELELPPPAAFNDRTKQIRLNMEGVDMETPITEQTVSDDQPSTSKSAYKSMGLRTIKYQRDQEKKQQKEQELKEKERLQKEKQQEEEQKEQQKIEQLQREKQRQIEKELNAKLQREQQQQKEQQHKEQMLREKQLREQQQKEKVLEEQKVTAQESHDNAQQQDQDVFKKPTAPAPRAKRSTKSRLEKQLANLRINLANETLAANENQAEEDATGVRRSKRGQVQLCNTWVHTVQDPFNFMRKNLEIGDQKRAAIKHKKPAAATAAAASASSSSITDRPPLSSSTPRNTPVPESNMTSIRKRDQQSEEQRAQSHPSVHISGISRLSCITDQDIGELPIETAGSPAAVSKKRGRKKKTLVEKDAPKRPKETKMNCKYKKPEKAATTNIAQAELPMPVHADDVLEQTSASSASNQSHEQTSETLMTWLCGASKVPHDTQEVSEVKTDSMLVSRAANLQFSKIDGVEYAFYNTEDLYSMGYMRFQPLQTRGLKRAKSNTLRFVALHGQFDFEVISADSTESHRDVLYTGDTIVIKKGNRYNITNRSDKVSVMMVQRK